MRIAVTGGSGLLGRYVVEELARSHDVTVIDLREPVRPGNFTYLRADVLSIDEMVEALSGHDAVAHLAGIPNPCNDPPEEVFRVNTQGTFTVMEAAARNNTRNLVYASSESTFGLNFRKRDFSLDYFPMDESHPLRPQDAYGLSKLVGEEICLSFARAYGIRTTSIRPCWVWAEEERDMQRELVANPQRWWKMLWAYVEARDAAQAFRLALESDEQWEHEAFLITADDNGVEVESRELILRYYPAVQSISSELAGYDSLIRCDKAKQMLGYKPLYSWRQFL